MVQMEVASVFGDTASRNLTSADIPPHEYICATTITFSIRAINGISAIRVTTGIIGIRAANGISAITDISAITGITGAITART